jgi:hypothetical protein
MECISRRGVAGASPDMRTNIYVPEELVDLSEHELQATVSVLNGGLRALVFHVSHL